MANFDKDKLSLVEYFLKQEKYTVYKNKARSNNNVYLYKIDNKQFQIIRIIDNFEKDLNEFIIDDEVVVSLKGFLSKKQQRAKLNVLSVVLTEDRSQIIKKEDGDVILAVDKTNYAAKLQEFYPKANILTENIENSNVGALSPEELMDKINDPDSNITKHLKELSQKLSYNNLVITWIISFVLLVFPLFIMLFGANLLGISNQTPSSILQLLFGGINRDLLVWSNQWWRLWTFWIYDADIFTTIINVFLLFLIARFTEAILGRWRMVVILIFGIPLVGLFLSSTMPNFIFAGSSIILSLLWGGLFTYNYGKDNLAELVSNKRTIIVPIWLIVFPIFTGQFMALLIVLVAFFIGSAISFLFDVNLKQKNGWTMLIYPLIILFGAIITILVCFLIRPYVPPYSPETIYTLIKYWQLGLIDKGTIENMLRNYYQLPKEKWPEILSEQTNALYQLWQGVKF
ncbi:rhomboid family intramembrane serine protease [Spiroplasma chrysopicola]|uniref:Putative rhomboid-like transmembrane protein n=1 Tax=Spiroplasma chrysopicola DF-1 TaxID=1276227 RepID=R4UIT8_9MOLU|nr:rhomboid family intramembrane serine protease [Spiroplasma chrysopicola]AGM25221.1 putative rhomboid-like transmembrane protein [Spiroplasma chrysopicola DF-1]